MALLVLIISPLIAALASLAVRKRIFWLETIAAVAASVEVMAAVTTSVTVYRQGEATFGSFLATGPLEIIVLMTVAVIGLAASFYSIGYLREEVRKQIIGFSRVRQYYVLMHLFLLAMFFAVNTTSPIMMWIAIEATTLSTAFLISFYGKAASMEAAWKYLIINSIGLLLGFFGTLLFLAPETSGGIDRFIDWRMLVESTPYMDPSLIKVAFIFVLIGYGTKAGLVPMHTWLPDAHSKAPSPISALLSGSLLNVALLAIVKFRIIADAALLSPFTRNAMIFFGLISIAIPAFIIIAQNNYKRLFAYSSIEHMGIITLGFGFGGLATFGALLHMIYHSLAKSTLFFCAGNTFLKYSSTKMLKVKGVLSSLPVTGIILVIAFLAITGVPPFGIFISEFYIFSAGSENFLPVVIGALFLLLLVFAGFLKHVVGMSLGEDAEPVAAGELNLLTVVPPVSLVVLLTIAGFYLPGPIRELIDSAATLINR